MSSPRGQKSIALRQLTGIQINVLHRRCQRRLKDFALVPEQHHDHTPAGSGKEGESVVGRRDEALFVGELPNPEQNPREQIKNDLEARL